MEAKGIVVVGAAGSQARAMLEALSRAVDLAGLTAVDLSWSPEAREEMEALSVEVVTGDVLLAAGELLLERRGAVSLLVNMAGPFYVIGTAALELAIKLGGWLGHEDGGGNWCAGCRRSTAHASPGPR